MNVLVLNIQTRGLFGHKIMMSSIIDKPCKCEDSKISVLMAMALLD